MARKGQELTFTFFVGGVQVDKLTPEQLDKMSERLSKSMSLYYSNHIDEYVKIKIPGEVTK